MNIKTVQLSTGLTLEYAEQGNSSGHVVICLHGYPDSWQSFSPVMPHLSPTIHAFALSQRGHGNSDRPDEGYDPKDFAADVALFMDKLNIDAAIVVGHSMGATIAQRFALDYPEKTKALVLIGAFATFKANVNMMALQEAVVALSDPVDPGFMEDFQKSTVIRPLSPAFLQTVVGESLKVPARVLKAVLSTLMSADYTIELPAVRQPVLLVWGDQDNLTGKENQHQLLRIIPGSRLSVYKGVEHSVHWEEPQRFAHELEEFVIENA
jgi:pimeloyl-ACP methyl ester carboxylesterase